MYVYIIAGEKRIKVGQSKNPEDRIKNIQHHVIEDLKIVYKSPSLEQYVLVERIAHKILKPYRIKGEWFKATSQQGMDAVNQAIFIVCNKNAMEIEEFLKPKTYKYHKVNISLTGQGAKDISELRLRYEKKYDRRISIREALTITIDRFCNLPENELIKLLAEDDKI